MSGSAMSMRTASQRREILVRVNRLIADLVPGYLDSRREELIEIRRLITDRDLERLEVIGHQLKGSGEGFGFREITLYGAQLEDAARAGDLRTVLEAADRLEDYLGSVRIVNEE